MSRTKKSKKADIAVEYLLERLQGPEMAGNPSKQISCLYILKASFEKSPMPRMAEVCFEHNILNSLMEMLQKEFNPRDKTNEVVLYSLAMELLWLFSTLGRSSLGPLLSEPLLTLLTAYLDINHRFYQFSPFFTKKVESLCRSTRFLQQKVTTVPMTKEIWNDILFYKPCMAVCGAVTHLHQCSLNIQVQGKPPVRSIAKRLISEHLAWAKCPKEPAASHDPVISGISELLHPQDYIPLQVDKLLDDDGEAEGCHEDVFVLDIIGGHYFWAYVGSEAMRTVDAITDQLLKEAPALKRFLPNLGNLVVVEEGGADGPSMMRGKVIEMSDDQVMVFAIDHGCMKQVTPSQIYQLSGSATCLANFGAQAKVCCLAGVQPPPAEEAAVEFALTTLTNLTKHFAPPGNIFEKAGGIDHLYELVRCASPGIKLQAIRLLSNISSIPHLSKSCEWTKFIRPLLDTLVQLVRKEVPDNTSRNMMVATLYALTNIMFLKQMYHEVFFELQGHIIVLNLMLMFKTSIPIVRAAAAMLRTAYPGLMRTIPRDAKNADFSGGSAGAGGDREEEEEGDEEMLVSQKHSQTAEEEFSDEEINYMMQHMMPKEEEYKSGTDGSSSRTGPSPVVSISSGSTIEESLGACGGIGEPRAACVGSDEGIPSAGSSLVPVDGGAIYRREDNSYEYNTFVPFRDDPTHHLLDVEDISNISINKLSELVCGMLNSRGGTIFMGLTKQGYIRGLKLDRNDRDSVRLGIDKIMTRTTPTIPHTQLQVNYVSVLHRVASGTMEPLPNRFVVEVVTRAPREPVYYTLGKAAVCYQRFGASTHRLSEQDVREMIVLEEESKYLPYVQSLRQKIWDLQQH